MPVITINIPFYKTEGEITQRIANILIQAAESYIPGCEFLIIQSNLLAGFCEKHKTLNNFQDLLEQYLQKKHQLIITRSRCGLPSTLEDFVKPYHIDITNSGVAYRLSQSLP